MIKLFEEDKFELNRASSKGNQLKFQRDGIWYKADYLGYEGLAEYAVSKLLRFSDLEPSEYVDYELEQIEYNGNVYNGCKSADFTEGKSLITLERLFKRVYGEGLNRVIYRTEDHTERLRILCEQVERVTGITGFGIYMSKLLTVDSLFLNEDRHTHNIAVLEDARGGFSLAPVFDNGGGLLSDTRMDFPMGRDAVSMIPQVKPKTFCDDFGEQLSIAEQLYGKHVRFSFTYQEVCDIVNAADIYDEQTRARVIEIIMQMRRKYAYLFQRV
ncbi:MAG: hypothetical protein IKI01_05905 [Lachnospiraceae bacterium]|nr:hypothetical protein [Lachnospiraceae bacterium]